MDEFLSHAGHMLCLRIMKTVKEKKGNSSTTHPTTYRNINANTCATCACVRGAVCVIIQKAVNVILLINKNEYVDKGNVILLINKNEYVDKMEEIQIV